MTKNLLLEKLKAIPGDPVVICEGEDGGWDNIQEVLMSKGDNTIRIVFGGGAPYD